MISNVFALIQIVLRAFGLWDAYLVHLDQVREAERIERARKHDKAIDDSKKAETDEEIWDAQDRIVDTKPRP